MTPLAALITGLTTGALSCFAVQGGLLVGLLARRREEGQILTRWQRLLLPVAAFLVAKIVVYTLLGFGLGWLGDKIQLTTSVRIWLQALAGTFMVLTGIRLVFPSVFPWLAFTPPASIRRLVRRSARSEAIVAPALLGALTILIPCGVTQAMEVTAISSGSVLQAGAILFAFTLGTAPLFFLIGVLAKGTTFLQSRLRYVAAAVVVGLGLYAVNGTLVLADSSYSVQRQVTAFERAFFSQSAAEESVTASDAPVINVLSNGYKPNVVTVQAGKPVKLQLKTDGIYACTSVFRIPKLKIEKTLPASGTTFITATFPEPGTYSFTCGMGMYRGTVNAI